MKNLMIIQSVGSVPYSVKAKIIMPILNKLIDDDYVGKNSKLIEELINANKEEEEEIQVKFGEV